MYEQDFLQLEMSILAGREQCSRPAKNIISNRRKSCSYIWCNSHCLKGNSGPSEGKARSQRQPWSPRRKTHKHEPEPSGFCKETATKSSLQNRSVEEGRRQECGHLPSSLEADEHLALHQGYRQGPQSRPAQGRHRHEKLHPAYPSGEREGITAARRRALWAHHTALQHPRSARVVPPSGRGSSWNRRRRKPDQVVDGCGVRRRPSSLYSIPVTVRVPHLRGERRGANFSASYNHSGSHRNRHTRRVHSILIPSTADRGKGRPVVDRLQVSTTGGNSAGQNSTWATLRSSTDSSQPYQVPETEDHLQRGKARRSHLQDARAARTRENSEEQQRWNTEAPRERTPLQILIPITQNGKFLNMPKSITLCHFDLLLSSLFSCLSQIIKILFLFSKMQQILKSRPQCTYTLGRDGRKLKNNT